MLNLKNLFESNKKIGVKFRIEEVLKMTINNNFCEIKTNNTKYYSKCVFIDRGA